MQKGTATLLLLIALFLAIGLLGVFSLVSPPPLKISTSTLKTLTYTNQKLGLEFQYPGQDLKVKEDSEEEFNQRGNGNFRKNFKGYVGYDPGEFLGAVVVLDKTSSFDNNPLSVWVFDNPDNLTTDSWFDKYWYYPFVWGVFDYSSKGHITPDTEATISGQLAKYKIVSYQPGSPKFIYVLIDKKMYLFRVIGNTGDQILSTFRFLQ